MKQGPDVPELQQDEPCSTPVELEYLFAALCAAVPEPERSLVLDVLRALAKSNQ